MKEKNLFQLDELGNRLYVRILQSPDEKNIMANIHLKKVGAQEAIFIANYHFEEEKIVYKNKKKINLHNQPFIAFEDCIFSYLPLEINTISFEMNGDWFEIPKSIFDKEKIYADGKNDNFVCKSYFPLNEAKKTKDFKFFILT